MRIYSFICVLIITIANPSASFASEESCNILNQFQNITPYSHDIEAERADYYYHADPEQTIHPIRDIERIYPGLVPEKMARLKNFKILKADIPLIKRDFPKFLEYGMSDQQILDWLSHECAGISIPQAAQEVVNTHIEIIPGEFINAFRPPSYGRAAIFAIHDPENPEVILGYMDLKGNGSLWPKQKSHGNGLGTIGEFDREYNYENAVRTAMKDANSTTKTIGSYFEADLGFYMRYEDGTLDRAGAYARQAHHRLNYDDDNIRSAWLDPSLKEPIRKTLAEYGIDTGHEGNIQGTMEPDGTVGLFDFGHYIRNQNMGDPEKALPVEQWGQPWWAKQGHDEWSLSQQDNAWNWGRDTAREVFAGHASSDEFLKLHDKMAGPFAEKLKARRIGIKQALWRDGKNPGVKNFVYGKRLSDPNDLKFMYLDDKERGALGRQMLEEILNQPLNPTHAKSVENALITAWDLKAAPGQSAQSLAKAKLRILEPTLKLVGFADNGVRRQVAANLLRKEIQDGLLEGVVAARTSTGALIGVPTQADQIRYLKDKKVPFFMHETSAGEKIPVFLVNSKTYRQVEPLLATSIGDEVKLFPFNSSSNDHGLYRVGRWQVDYYLPGESSFGETNSTGISWRHLPSYVARKGSDSERIMEVGYQLSPAEQETSEYYHRVRRAGIFKSRHEFRYDNPSAYNGKISVLDWGPETCYKFGTGMCASYHSQDMKSALQDIGVANPNRLLEDPRTRVFLENVKSQLLAKPLEDTGIATNPAAQEALLHDWSLMTPENLQLVRDIMPDSVKNGDDATKVRFMNFLVGIDASRKYSALTKDLGMFHPTTLNANFPERTFADAKRKRASFMLFFDASPDSEQKFLDATYETDGNRYKFRNNGSHSKP